MHKNLQDKPKNLWELWSFWAMPSSSNPQGIDSCAIPSNSPRQVTSVITLNPFLIMFNRSNYIFTFYTCSYEGRKILIPEYTEGWCFKKKKSLGDMSILKPCLKETLCRVLLSPHPEPGSEARSAWSKGSSARTQAPWGYLHWIM